MKTLCLLEEKLRDPLALSRLSQFRYIEVNKKESVQNINREHEFLLCFVLKGSICILKNKIDHAPCVVMQDEVLPVNELTRSFLDLLVEYIERGAHQ